MYRQLPMRYALAERDGPHCVWCGKRVKFTARKPSKNGLYASKDHVIPRFMGGIGHIDNYMLSCRDCNSKRHHDDVFEFIGKAASPDLTILIQAWVRAQALHAKQSGMMVA